MTFRLLGKTRSGVPGRSGRCNLYRYPMPCTSLRTAISGVVSLDFTLRIARVRCAGVRLSADRRSERACAWVTRRLSAPIFGRRRMVPSVARDGHAILAAGSELLPYRAIPRVGGFSRRHSRHGDRQRIPRRLGPAWLRRRGQHGGGGVLWKCRGMRSQSPCAPPNPRRLRNLRFPLGRFLPASSPLRLLDSLARRACRSQSVQSA
jgi:hypothetical protein